MKKLYLTFLILLILCGVGFWVASRAEASPNWDITETWTLTFTIGGSNYIHTGFITSFNRTTGDFSGNGYYNTDHNYSWDITGNVNGSAITYSIVYNNLNPGYTLNGTGTINESGTIISSTISGDASGTCEWTEGPATSLTQSFTRISGGMRFTGGVRVK